MSATSGYEAMVKQALGEVGDALSGVGQDAADRICDEIIRARTIVCFGLGREGLIVRAFCMRLMHLGLRAFVVFDVTTPPVGSGDLVVVSAGPGELKTAETIVDLSKPGRASSSSPPSRAEPSPGRPTSRSTCRPRRWPTIAAAPVCCRWARPTRSRC
jgi:6-phospho-3-hexuloisomerase